MTRCRYCRATRQAHIRGCPNVNGTAARYAVTIGNADGSRSRTIHLYAADAVDAIARPMTGRNPTLWRLTR